MKPSKNSAVSKPSAGDIDQSLAAHAAALGVPVEVLEPSLAPRRRRLSCRRGAGVCRVCGCTDRDCRRCIVLTGEACYWIEPDLCSACTGWARIQRERQRQREVEGFDHRRDCGYVHAELRHAALCYATPQALRSMVTLRAEWTGQRCAKRYVRVPQKWPWAPSWWKPTPHNRARELEKAGALFLAEASRLRALQRNFTADRMVTLAKRCGRKIDALTRAGAGKKGGRA